MKKWQALAAAGFAAAAATAAALIVSKNKGQTDDKIKTKEKKAAPAAKSAPKNTAEGIYDFVSGYKEAKHQEVNVKYDKEKFTFSVVEDEFLSYSSDSHVAVMYGDDFNMQIEYAEYYPGDDFGKLKGHILEKFKGYGEDTFNGKSSCRYTDGDSLCYCLDAGESYILITVIPAKDSKETVQSLPDNSDLQYILNQMSVTAK